MVGCYPLSIPARTATQVELIGFNLPPNAKATVPAAPPGEATVPLDAKQFHSRGPLQVIVADLPERLAGGPKGEPNDTPARATPMTAPGSANGRIAAPAAGAQSSANYFKFDSKAGQSWIVETEAARRGSPLDTRIEVLTADGRPIPRVLLQAVRDSFINFRGIDSQNGQPRLKNYEEMDLNQFIYMRGEVCKLFQYPQGPDSDFFLYRDLAGRRRTFFDTTSVTHANFEPVFVVVPHPPGERLADNGLPVFEIDYANDDASDRSLGRDSRVHFTAPADGSYLVRVSDSRGEGGPRFLYRLTVRPPHPDFNVRVTDMNPTVSAGSGKRFKLQADRLDEFDGDIRLDITGLPPGFAASTPLVIQAGHQEAVGVISALAWAPPPTPENASTSKITATARDRWPRSDEGGRQPGPDQARSRAAVSRYARSECVGQQIGLGQHRYELEVAGDAEDSATLGRGRAGKRALESRGDAYEAARSIAAGWRRESGERFLYRRRRDRRQAHSRRSAGSARRQKSA